jgi:hypothetical protein
MSSGSGGSFGTVAVLLLLAAARRRWDTLRDLVVGSMVIGWGVTAALHLAVGSPAGLPAGEEVRALLGTIGLEPASVFPHRTRPGGRPLPG